MESMHKRDITVYRQHHTKHLLYSVPIAASTRVEIRRPEPLFRNYEKLSQLCDVINCKHAAILMIMATNSQGRKQLDCTVTAAYSTAICVWSGCVPPGKIVRLLCTIWRSVYGNTQPGKVWSGCVPPGKIVRLLCTIWRSVYGNTQSGKVWSGCVPPGKIVRLLCTIWRSV